MTTPEPELPSRDAALYAAAAKRHPHGYAVLVRLTDGPVNIDVAACKVSLAPTFDAFMSQLRLSELNTSARYAWEIRSQTTVEHHELHPPSRQRGWLPILQANIREEELRAALRSCIEHLENGSHLSPDASHEMHCRVPLEVAAYVQARSATPLAVPHFTLGKDEVPRKEVGDGWSATVQERRVRDFVTPREPFKDVGDVQQVGKSYPFRENLCFDEARKAAFEVCLDPWVGVGKVSRPATEGIITVELSKVTDYGTLKFMAAYLGLTGALEWVITAPRWIPFARGTFTNHHRHKRKGLVTTIHATSDEDRFRLTSLRVSSLPGRAHLVLSVGSSARSRHDLSDFRAWSDVRALAARLSDLTGIKAFEWSIETRNMIYPGGVLVL